jgi:hypothetical protein
MGDGKGDVTPGDGTEWISLGEAARRLGVTRAAVYGRIERRTLETRPKGNRGLEVLWPPPQRHHNGKDDVALTVMGDVTALLDELRERLGHEVVDLRQQVDELHGKLDAAQAQIADLRVELATARGEVAAKDAVLAEVRAQVDREVARGDALATQIAEARRPLWRRWIGG